MKALTLALVILLAGCATPAPPVWQQELNNLNRQWRSSPDPIIYPNAGIKRPDPDRLLMCRF